MDRAQGGRSSELPVLLSAEQSGCGYNRRLFYGCFLVIEAHGGTWFRTPCPNCRAKPFKVLSVSGSAPTPQKGPFRGCDLRSAFWRPVGSDSQAGTSFLGPTRHKPAPATRGSEGRWFNSRPLSRNGQRLLVTSWHNDGDRRQHGGMVTAPWPRRRPQTICDSPSDSAIHLRILFPGIHGMGQNFNACEMIGCCRRWYGALGRVHPVRLASRRLGGGQRQHLRQHRQTAGWRPNLADPVHPCVE